MKRIILSLFLVCCYNIQYGQSWLNTKHSFGGTGQSFVEEMIMDPTGATYVAGNFVGQLTHGSGISITSNGYSTTPPVNNTGDIFLAKNNDQMNEQWFVSINSSGTEGAPKIAFAKNGNILVAGAFSNTCFFGPNPTDTLISSTGNSLFLAMYNSNTGALMWKYAILRGLATAKKVGSLAVDKDGNILVGGSTPGNAKFYGKQGASTTNIAGNTGFMAKFSPEGEFLWEITFNAPGSNTAGNVLGIVTSEDHYYLVSQTITASPGTANTKTIFTDRTPQTIDINNTSSYGSASRYFWIVATDFDGKSQWVKQTSGSSYNATPVSMVLSANNHLILGGTYQSAAPWEFGETIMSKVGNSPTPAVSTFLLTLSSIDGSLKDNNSVVSGGTNAIYNLKIKDNIFYTCGLLDRTIPFNHDIVPNGIATLALSLGEQGNIMAVGAASSITTDNARSVVFNPKSFIIAGEFSSKATIGNDSYTSNGGPKDIYMAEGCPIIGINDTAIYQVKGCEPTDKSGAIKLDIAGDAGPYTYHWTRNGTLLPGETESMLQNIDAGIYKVTVSYNRGLCTKSRSFEITAPNAVRINDVVIANAACGAGNKGTITVDAGGPASSTLTYTIKGGIPPATDTYLYTNDDGKFNCEAARYTLTVQVDGTECKTEKSVLVSSKTNTFDITVDEVVSYNCNLLNSPIKEGKVVATSDNALPMDFFGLVDAATGATQVAHNGTNASTNIFEEVAPGTYKVIAGFYRTNGAAGTDAGCLQESDPVIISQPDPIVIESVQAVDITCYGTETGRITVSATGGTGALAYSLLDEENNMTVPHDNPSSSVFPELSEGIYTATVTDTKDCSQSYPRIIVFDNNQEIDVILNKKFDSCHDADNGSFQVTASGGEDLAGNFLYYLYLADETLGTEPTNASGIFTNLAPEDYKVHVRERTTGCTEELAETVTINNLDQIGFTAVPTGADCNGKNTGYITVSNITGGTGNGYKVTVTNGTITRTVSTSPYVVTGLAAGPYVVTVSDDYNCSEIEQNIVVGEPAALTVTVNPTDVTNVSCNGYRTGKIIAQAAGGTSSGAVPYQFELYQGSELIEGPQPGNEFDELLAGTGYMVKVIDANNCTAATSSLNINQPNAMVINTTRVDVNCNRDKGSITVTSVSGGAGSYRYSLRNADDDPLVAFQTTPEFTDLDSGTYIIKVIDGQNCIRNSDVVPIVYKAVWDFTEKVKDACYGKEDGVITIKTDEMGLIYSITGRPEQSEPVFAELRADDYTVTLKNTFNCTADRIITVDQPDAALTATYTTTDASTPTTANGIITVTTIIGGTPPYVIHFNNDAQIIPNPVLPYDFTGLLPGTYGFVVADENNCRTPYAPQIVIGFVDAVGDMEAAKLTIYPNPTDGRFTILWDTPKDMRVTLEIFNTAGGLVYKVPVQTGTGGTKTEINISNQAKGTYLLRVPELMLNQKIVVQ